MKAQSLTNGIAGKLVIKRQKQLAKAISIALGAGLTVISGHALAYVNGEQVPSVVQQIATGSQADVKTSAVYDPANQTWTVTWWRKLKTGDASRDIQFTAGNTYPFQVATFDNQDGFSSMTSAGHIGDSSTVYTFSIPKTAGALTFSGVPAKLTAISGSLLKNDEITITATWKDSTRNDQLGQWTYNLVKKKGSWKAPDPATLSQDQIALTFDIQNANFAAAGTCDSQCHTGSFSMATNQAGAILDVWNWKAATSGPIGQAVDRYMDNGGGNASGLHQDAGTSSYAQNDLVNGHPRYVSDSDPIPAGASKYLFLLPDGNKPGVKPASFPTTGWKNGNVLPPNAGRPARGPLADITTTSQFDGKQWIVTFRRKLNTGGDSGHDIVFEKGKSYSFLYTIHDNADDLFGTGGVMHTTMDPETPHTMTIPNAPGPLVFPVKPGHLNEISGELLDTDELVIKVSWPDTTRNDIKRQWKYDAANPAAPWLRANTFANSSADEQKTATFSADRFQFLWDTVGDNFATAGNCQEMCHSAEGAMRTKAGTIDAWNWTGTASATGFGNDQYWDSNNGTGNGLNKSDGGSQSSSATNTGYQADGKTALASADTKAAVLTYTPVAGPGAAVKYLYADSPQADGFNPAVTSFVQNLTSYKVVAKAKGSFTVSGTYDVGGAALGLPNAETRIALGDAVDVTIPAGAFKSKGGGKLLSYVSKADNLNVLINTKTKTFQVTGLKKNLSTLAKPAVFTFKVGSYSSSPLLNFK